MTKYDAEHLLRTTEGRLCVRYYQRTDGTILTKDCPVGWAKVKQRLSLAATAAFSLFVSLFAGLFAVSYLRKNTEIGKRIPIPFATPSPKYEPLMGAVAMPSPTPTPKASPSPKVKRQIIEVMGDVDVAPAKPA
jgi:hypothetical protein